MRDTLQQLIQQLEPWFAILGILSLSTFIGSIVLVPMVVASMPRDYFVASRHEDRELTPARLVLHLLKNVLGYLFLILGVLMLFLPGQGLLTIILGMCLIDFPGKRRFQLRLLKPRKIRKSIDWMRRRSGKEPFKLPF